jgi:chromosome condensin MukBEF MukE localization factor
MTKMNEEVRATIARLKREGTYHDYLKDADKREIASIAATLRFGLELTDQEVEDLWRELPSENAAETDELRDEADRAIARLAAKQAGESSGSDDRWRRTDTESQR